MDRAHAIRHVPEPVRPKAETMTLVDQRVGKTDKNKLRTESENAAFKENDPNPPYGAKGDFRKVTITLPQEIYERLVCGGKLLENRTILCLRSFVRH
jgi:hypothetical protein